MIPKDNAEQLRSTLVNILGKLGDKDALKNFTKQFSDIIKEVKSSAKEEQSQDDGGDKTIEELYFHLFNGGATFSVVDEGHGATIQVKSASFGNMDHKMKLHTTHNALRELGEMFIRASEYQGFSDDYMHTAKPTHNEQVQDDSGKDGQ